MSREFAGTSSSYLNTTGNISVLTITNGAQWTMSWILDPLGNEGTTPNYFYSQRDFGATTSFHVYLRGADQSNANAVIFDARTSGGTTLRIDGNTQLNLNQFNHIALFSDGTTIRMRVNGTLQTDNTSDNTVTATAPLHFGRQSAGDTARAFNGRIAEFARWDTELVIAQNAQIALGVSAIFIEPESLRAYVTFISGFSDFMGQLTFTDFSSIQAIHPRIFRPAGPTSQSPTSVIPFFRSDIDVSMSVF